MGGDGAVKWETAILSDISTNIQTGPFGSQLHQSDYSIEGTPVVMPKDLVNGHISEATIARISDAHIERLSRHKIEIGDILYSRRGDVGRCAFATEKEAGWLCGTGCLRVSTDVSKANPKFVFYQLQKPDTIGWVEKHAVGATMLNLNTAILSRVPIEIPSLNTQNRIVDILSAYDNLIENNQKQIKLLEEAAQRLYKEWFVDLRFPGYETTPVVDGLPEGWESTTLENICALNKQVLAQTDIPPNIPYIGLEHMPRKDICLCEWGTSSEVLSSKFLYQEKDIIFGKIRPYFHKVGFALNSGIASTDSIIMRANEGVWGLLLMTVSSVAFVDYVSKTCKEGSKMPRADWNQMKAYPILIPDEGTREKFEVNIGLITDRIKALALQNRGLAEARDRLLPKLMSGELEV